MNTTNPCSCWLAPPSALHSGHCCFDTNAPEGCHDEVLTAAAAHCGSTRGKMRLADTIAALLPEHRHYVEPFAGSLAFWRVLRDRPAEIEVAMQLTQHSRAEHLGARDLADLLGWGAQR